MQLAPVISSAMGVLISGINTPKWNQVDIYLTPGQLSLPRLV